MSNPDETLKYRRVQCLKIKRSGWLCTITEIIYLVRNNKQATISWLVF